MINQIDPRFLVTPNLAGCSPDPIAACWIAQHVCVADSVYPSTDKVASGGSNALIKQAAKGDWSVFRHAYASFSIEGFPHDTAMQWRTHRASNILTQSQRYTGQRFLDLYDALWRSSSYEESVASIEELFYIPAIGSKVISRDGMAGCFTAQHHHAQCNAIVSSVNSFKAQHDLQLPFEKCRHVLAPCYRQAWVITATYTDLMHLLDQRLLANAQDTARIAAQMMLEQLIVLCPEIWVWYQETRAGKARLSP